MKLNKYIILKLNCREENDIKYFIIDFLNTSKEVSNQSYQHDLISNFEFYSC